MPAVIVNEDRCQSSQVCVSACPYDAIGMVVNEGGRAVARIYDNCVDCLLCVSACPQQAISLVATYGLPVEPDLYGGVWAIVPDAKEASLDVVAQAVHAARSLHTRVGAILLGPDTAMTRLMAQGVEVVVLQTELDQSGGMSDALMQFVDVHLPEVLLFANCTGVRDLAEGLATQLQIDLNTEVGYGDEPTTCRLSIPRPLLNRPFNVALMADMRPQLAVPSGHV